MAVSFQSRSANSSVFHLSASRRTCLYVIFSFASLSFFLLDFTHFRSCIMYNIAFMISLIMNLMDVLEIRVAITIA